ncbi:hypothetical protein I6A60_13205 [Frankia sp. AgB1.9]|uniref:Uncharacterized protein n=1 Tax=Pseudofrankia inefficax (strain DSM 45817 / CECT 9037 / DDB 130130 / EuI1c) TaxID=298654 RepID=E3J2I7_PSEI1|nr:MULTISPECIES: hypothetical protein [Frankiaceae]ADP80501.1 hypothetical protein FraEuI1c_2467 [Pseudofrankia inefficax]MBL7491151.1 hypothetical protein [Frankia sp. AgW1.1]MBL7548827.1 hypothetical protein [Frankia sp. AgB1.9]MBL7621666.1 hypothetical protein [Frankia sp. AgB1.8]
MSAANDRLVEGIALITAAASHDLAQLAAEIRRAIVLAAGLPEPYGDSDDGGSGDDQSAAELLRELAASNPDALAEATSKIIEEAGMRIAAVAYLAAALNGQGRPSLEHIALILAAEAQDEA